MLSFVRPARSDSRLAQSALSTRLARTGSHTQRGFRTLPIVSATAAVNAPTPTTASKQRKPIATYQHLIICPDEGLAAGKGNSAVVADCLLAVAPGALLPPDAFSALARAVQAAAPHLRLWCGIVNLDYASLTASLCGPNTGFPEVLKAYDEADVYGQLQRQLVEQAEAKGFVPRREGPGRIANMVVLCQSAGSMGFGPLAVKTAAASIFLASALNVPDSSKQQMVSMETWPRPVMVLLGELDGQMRWPVLSKYIAETAIMATKFGTGFVARNKPVVVLPGVNHGNTSNGVPRTVRGDITTGVTDYDASVRALADNIAAFITAHLGPSDQVQEEANETLLEAVRQSMRLTAPYCRALGLGDPSAPFEAPVGSVLPPAVSPEGPVREGGLIAGAQQAIGQAQSNALAPGEVAEAEAYAVELQRLVLSELPATAVERVTVVATAHTDVETLLYSQPVMTPLGGGKWLLHVHVMLHYRCLDAELVLMAPKAPDYWVKLKCAAFVAAMLGLPDPAQYGTPKPADLNAHALKKALEAAPAAVVDRYRTLGRQMEFGDDVDALAPGPEGSRPASPEPFVRESRIMFKYPPGTAAGAPGTTDSSSSTDGAAPDGMGAVRVSSPYVLMPPTGDTASRPLSETRFMGPFYTKVLSVPLAMEWVWIDCLRGIPTPW